MIDALLYTAYGLTTVAFIIKDILWLRVLMTIGSVVWMVLGALWGQLPVIIFNALYFGINGYQIFQLYLERRPIELPADLVDLYEQVFPNMSHKEFLYFWNTGNKVQFVEEIICREGGVPDNLLLILGGNVSVFRGRQVINYLTRGRFVAEISFLTKKPASADVKAEGEVECIAWSQENLRGLRMVNPDLFIKLQVILGKDLSAKLVNESLSKI